MVVAVERGELARGERGRPGVVPAVQEHEAHAVRRGEGQQRAEDACVAYVVCVSISPFIEGDAPEWKPVPWVTMMVRYTPSRGPVSS